MIVSNPEVLIPTLQSRFIRIYFPRLNSKTIKKLLVGGFKASAEEADEIITLSFGRPGRAVDLISNQGVQEKKKLALLLLGGRANKKKIIGELIEEPSEIDSFFYELIAWLAREPVKNYHSLRQISNRLTKMKQFTTNRRAQLELALWNI